MAKTKDLAAFGREETGSYAQLDVDGIEADQDSLLNRKEEAKKIEEMLGDRLLRERDIEDRLNKLRKTQEVRRDLETSAFTSKT